MTIAKVLVIDDEAAIRRLVGVALRRADYGVVEADSAAAALRMVKAERPDIILLDLGLPDRDGLELIPLLKAESDAALLIVSARDATEEKVAALDLGGDDYVTKPFDTDELLARLRTAARHRTVRSADRLHVGDLLIDLGNRRIERAGEDIHLTRKEFALLAELAGHPGRVITHGQLLRSVWGGAHGADIEYVRVVVRNLRQKIEPDPARPTIIVNDPGVGYRIKADREPGVTHP